MFYSLLAVFVGALTAVQSRLNGQLSKDIHNGIAAAVISFGSGWLILWILCFGMKQERVALAQIYKATRNRTLKWWQVIGGIGGGLFVATQSISVPKIGVAIFTICVVGGQTASSLLVDRFGIGPSGIKKITAPRVFAAAMTLIAVTVAVFPNLRHATLSLVPVVLVILVGGVIAVQQALNGRVNVIGKRPLATAFLNFLMGFMVLLIALAIDLKNGGTIGALPHHWWLYCGGIVGVIFISVAAFTIKHLGVLNFILFQVTGQLIGAVLLDWLAPAANTSISGYLLTGTVLTIGAIATSRYYEAKR